MALKQILELHKKWLNNEDGGKRADLSRTDLSGAYLWDVTGNKKEIFTFQTNKYTVVIYQDRIQIGCKNFSQSEWFNFSDDEISEMDSKALDWWCTHKHQVKTWCEMVNSYSK